ncbi:MAG: hypothetical protein PHI77_00415 [Candidatus Pacebacteria bacterium]|nr:hypothetical protein [Candidatus Paceibacterota bacterium]MDD4874856.1 hypothetical protein [Candidatus Paceibacterota bacterium]
MISREHILPAITSISGSWRSKVEEIDELGIKKAALFPTCLNSLQRQDLYNLLEKTKIEEIPFVHLRSDMSPQEIDFLIKRYKTKVFNIHSPIHRPLLFDLSSFRGLICIENTIFSLSEKILKTFAGFCIDFSHLENDRILKPERYKEFCELISSTVVGCNHISAVRKEPFFDERAQEDRIACHFLQDFSELDYLKNYPQEYFSKYIALELENDLKTQLEAKNYIFDLLKDCW